MMKILEKAVALMKEGYVCDSCLGRNFAELLTGYTNEQRGKAIRLMVAFLVDSGEKIEVDASNFHGIKFRNVKPEMKKAGRCKVCKDFFLERIDDAAKEAAKELKKVEFKTFLAGSIVPDEMLKAEDELWAEGGIEFVEPIKSEINREVGKKIEKLTGKKFDLKNPDVIVLVNVKTGKVKVEVRNIYILGEYKKLVRGLPQTIWEGHKSSVQQIIEKPFLKAMRSKGTKFHGAGREDVDVRCLDYRKFVLEIIKPVRRTVKLKELEKAVNRSGKVKVKLLKFSDKEMVKRLKTERTDKTYLAEVGFEKKIDRKRLKELKNLAGEIEQKTPIRVIRGRSDRYRRRKVKAISWKVLRPNRLQLKIRTEAGLYIKELIIGDGGRTKPNVAELLGDKVKDIKLDVIKIHD